MLNLGFTLLLIHQDIIFANGFNLLLIGDSFDRYFTFEWCGEKFASSSVPPLYSKNKPYIQNYGIVWTDESLAMDPSKLPLFCKDKTLNDTVAFLPIFGSNLTNPYHMNHTEKYDDTDYRISLGLQNYFDLIGNVPDRIMITTTQWDAIYLANTQPDVKHADQRYRYFMQHKLSNLNILIDMVQNITRREINRRCEVTSSGNLRKLTKTSSVQSSRTEAKQVTKSGTNMVQPYTRPTHSVKQAQHRNWCKFTVDIGLRSTTRTIKYSFPEIITDMNAFNHDLTIQRNLTWYDMEADIWSYSDYHDDWRLFRDSLHPIKSFSVPTINKLLGRQYSQFISHHGGSQQLSHIITNQSQLNSYNGMNFQLIRALAANNIKKNKQIEPIRNVTHNKIHHSIPGHGPIYYSAFINGSRVKWFLGDVTKQFSVHQSVDNHSNKRHQSNITSANNHSTVHETHKQYEHHMRIVLRQLLLTTSDLVLLSDDLLNSIPTQGVMPILFNNTFPIAFTFRNTTNSHKLTLCLTKPLTPIPVLVPQSLEKMLLDVILANKNIAFHQNIDPFWLSIIQTPQYDIITPPDKLYKNNTLLRHYRDPSVQVVLNGTRHYFSGLESFTKRGYDFSNVLKYDDKLSLYVDLMPVGEILT